MSVVRGVAVYGFLLMYAASAWSLQTGDAEPPKQSSPTSGNAAQVLALTGARIHTMDRAGVIESGTILIRDGLIAEVGAQVVIPDGAERLDCTGLVVTPGLIDARSQLWMDPASARQSGGDGSLDAFDALDGYTEDWMDAVRAGVTAVYLQPASSDICGGVGVVASAAPGETGVSVLKRDAGLQVALGVGSDTSGRGRSRQFDRLKKLFSDTKKYADEWKAYSEYEAKQKAKATEAEGKPDESAKPDSEEGSTGESSGESNPADDDAGRGSRRGRRGGPPSGDRPDTGNPSGTDGRRGEAQERGRPVTQDGGKQDPGTQSKGNENQAADGAEKKEEKAPEKPKSDPVKDRLVRVLEGEIPVRFEVHHPDDARRAHALAKEFGFRLVLEGVTGSGAATTALREARLPMVLGPWISGSSPNAELIQLWNEDLSGYDGRVALASFGGSGRATGGLRMQIAQAIAAGYPRDRALQAVTRDAAELLGVGDQIGSITEGRRADLAIFGGDPFDVSRPVQMTLVSGKRVYGGEPQVVSDSDHQLVDHLDLPARMPSKYSVVSDRVLMADGTFAVRTLTVADGKIVDNVAGRVAVEDGTLFDLGQAVITPGLFAAYTSLGISSRDFATAESDARHLFAADGFDAINDAVLDFAEGGVLSALLVPPSANTLGGHAALVRLGGRPSVLRRDLGESLVLNASARRRDQFPATLLGQLEMVAALMDESGGTTRIFLPDIAQQKLLESREQGTRELLAGKRLAIIAAEKDAEVKAALDLISQMGLRAALYGVEHVDRFANYLSETRSQLVVPPLSESSFPWQVQGVVDAAALDVSLWWSGNSAMDIRRSAAMAVAHGLEEAQALRGMTSHGMSGLMGETGPSGFEPGAAADFVVWTGNPLDLRAKAAAVMVGGDQFQRPKSSGN